MKSLMRNLQQHRMGNPEVAVDSSEPLANGQVPAGTAILNMTPDDMVDPDDTPP
jgi:hypothetical protein